jgi:hypothetical protein
MLRLMPIRRTQEVSLGVRDTDGNVFYPTMVVLDTDGNPFTVTDTVLDTDGNGFRVL